MDLVEKRVNGTTTMRHPWEDARYQFVLDKVGPLIDLNANVCVFDIGCGDAYFIAKLSRQFPNIQGVGVDINFTDDDLQSIPESYGLSNLSIFKTVDEAKAMNRKPDLILLMDVIEHIEHDKEFLSELIRPLVVDDGAIALITVPAFQGLFTQHDVFLKHYRRYDNALLRKTVNEAGLSIQQIGYFFAMLLPLRIIEKLKDKLLRRTSAEGLANWNGGPFITRALYGLLVADTRISAALRRMGINLPGLSNYVICRR